MMSLYDIFLKDTSDLATLANFGNAWVDVRDIARAHVRALVQPEARGRIIVSRESFKLQDWRECPRLLSLLVLCHRAHESS